MAICSHVLHLQTDHAIETNQQRQLQCQVRRVRISRRGFAANAPRDCSHETPTAQLIDGTLQQATRANCDCFAVQDACKLHCSTCRYAR